MKTAISLRIRRAMLIFSASLFMTTILGCTIAPANTGGSPTPASSENPLPIGGPIFIRNDVGISYIRLSDGSEIFLSEYTDIQLTTVAGLTIGASEHEIVIQRGQIAINSHLPVGKWFTIKSPNGFIARVTGSIIVVSYSPDDGRFIADCIQGDCELGVDIQQLLQLAALDQGWLDQNGNFNGPFEVNVEDLINRYGTWIGTAPTLTPTFTPEKFTETPTPYTQTPDVAATATSACATFQAQFPGTPCP